MHVFSQKQPKAFFSLDRILLGRGNQDRDIGRYEENLARYLSLNDAKFDYGRCHYQTIAIPGYDADMSSLAMKKLFLSEQLNK